MRSTALWVASAPDHLRELATYTANLVLVRAFLEAGPDGVPLSSLSAPDTDPHENWRSLVQLRDAGLAGEVAQGLRATPPIIV